MLTHGNQFCSGMRANATGYSPSGCVRLSVKQWVGQQNIRRSVYGPRRRGAETLAPPDVPVPWYAAYCYPGMLIRCGCGSTSLSAAGLQPTAYSLKTAVPSLPSKG